MKVHSIYSSSYGGCRLRAALKRSRSARVPRGIFGCISPSEHFISKNPDPSEMNQSSPGLLLSALVSCCQTCLIGFSTLPALFSRLVFLSVHQAKIELRFDTIRQLDWNYSLHYITESCFVGEWREKIECHTSVRNRLYMPSYLLRFLCFAVSCTLFLCVFSFG